MDREILFRGKRIDNGEWIYGSYLTCLEYDEKTGVHAIFNWSYADKDEDAAVDPETVGQFTGLVDKNGAKIFEDDVVKVEIYGCGELALVMYFLGCFFLSGLSFGDVPLFKYIDEESDSVMVEIIGNEHDNPGLWAGGPR